MKKALSTCHDDSNAIPAVIFCDQTAELRIAGLTLLDRLIVSAHRAGCAPIIVVSREKSAATERAAELGIPVQFQDTSPAFDTTVLIATTSLLAQTADIALLLKSGGRLTDHDGGLLRMGVAPQFAGTIDDTLASLTPIPPAAVARRVADHASAKDTERALWASITSSCDGLIDRVFNRPVSRPLSKLLVHTPVSPNAVSLASIFVGLLAAGLFAVGEYTASIIAAILFQISAVIDCIDGDLARVMFKESAFGKWLDLAGDQVVHVAVFGGIALGLMKSTPGTSAPWLGLSAIVGALLSFAVVVRGLRRPQLDRTGLLHKLINAATNRDFSVLVLFLAALNELDLFLWVTAVGSHVFWITTLALQLGTRSAEARAQ